MLQIRKVIKEDSDILLEWRNDPLVYQFALNATPVSLEDHQRWFEKVLISKQVVLFIAIFDGQKCGSVRYDLSENGKEAEVSITISPAYQGKGIASEFMKMAEEKLKLETKIKIIYATVLNENVSSLGLFKKSSFNEYSLKFKKEI